MPIKRIFLFFLLITLSSETFADDLNILKFEYNSPTVIDKKYLNPIDCTAPDISPPEDLMFNSVYKRDDPTRSILDPLAIKRYREKTLPLMRYENKVIRLSNYYLKSGKQNKAYAQCSLNWLYSWAKNNALLGEDNLAGEIARQWTLTSLASAYIQIKDENALNLNKRQKVEQWLRSLAAKVIKTYPYETDRDVKKNNHLYWAAWAVTATGIALNDDKLFNWGMNRAQFVITQQIDHDGTLPLEVRRGKKALHYHQFAANPLVMLAEAGLQNNVDLYKIRNGRLHFFIKRILVGFQNPVHFERITGIPQMGVEDLSAGNLAWLEVYNKRFPNPTAQYYINQKGKMFSRRLGGDMTFLFGMTK